MNLAIRPISKHFTLPFLGSEGAAGYDITMCQSGSIPPQHSEGIWVNLGFAAAVPAGHVALLLPRSGKGCKQGLMLNNTMGVIDSDFRGEWRACLRSLNDRQINWDIGDCLLQLLIIRSEQVSFVVSNELPETTRGAGGFGSTG